MKKDKLLKMVKSLNVDGFILLYFKEEDITIIIQEDGYSFTYVNLFIDGKLSKEKKISFHMGRDKIKDFNFESFDFESNEKLTDKIFNRLYHGSWTK